MHPLAVSQPVLLIGPDECGNKVLPESRTSIRGQGIEEPPLFSKRYSRCACSVLPVRINAPAYSRRASRSSGRRSSASSKCRRASSNASRSISSVASFMRASKWPASYLSKFCSSCSASSVLACRCRAKARLKRATELSGSRTSAAREWKAAFSHSCFWKYAAPRLMWAGFAFGNSDNAS